MCENHFRKVLLINTISTNQFLQAFMFCPIFFLFAFNQRENYNISNIIIIMSIIIITVQKYAQTPQLN